jgi:GH35 family endo-1,4-beta-xylanase
MKNGLFSGLAKTGFLFAVTAMNCLIGINAQNWYETAEERIDTLRKGDFTLHITDTAGNPVTDTVYIRLKKHEFPWGNTVDKPDNTSVSKWKQAALLKYYNSGVVERFKWPYMENTKGNVNYAEVDSVYAWASRVGWDVRAHTLLWGGSNSWQMPGWTLSLQGKELYDACETHVRREVGRYKGIIKEYDVMNEPVHETWLATNAGDSINWNCFKWANETDSAARLFVNDYNIIVWGSATDYINKIQQMLNHGAPIGGIGAQGHMEGTINWTDVKNKLDMVATLGLPIKITEFDMKIDEQNITEKNMASAYGTMMRTCFSHPAVAGFIWWGFVEPVYRAGSGIFTQDKRPKIAADTVYHLIHEKWSTNIKVKPEADGTVQFHGFYGDYAIGIKVGDEYEVVPASCRKINDGGDIAVSLTDGVPEPPLLLYADHNEEGSKVYLHFDKEMQDPAGMHKNFLIYTNIEVPVNAAGLNTTDNHIIELSLSTNLSYNKYYSVVYTPGTLKAIHGGILYVTGPETIVNKIPGFVSAQTTPEGDAIEISLSHPMNDLSGSLSAFAVTVNNVAVTSAVIGYKDGFDSVLVITLANPIASSGDKVKVSYTRGTLASTDGFLLENFSSKPVENLFPSGIENKSTIPIHVYPNPFAEKLIIEFTAGIAIDEIVLSDITGREIRRVPANNLTFTSINTNGIGKGIYTLQFVKDNVVIEARKVAKE